VVETVFDIPDGAVYLWLHHGIGRNLFPVLVLVFCAYGLWWLMDER